MSLTLLSSAPRGVQANPSNCRIAADDDRLYVYCNGDIAVMLRFL
jgi:hypothetical protein